MKLWSKVAFASLFAVALSLGQTASGGDPAPNTPLVSSPMAAPATAPAAVEAVPQPAPVQQETPASKKTPAKATSPKKGSAGKSGIGAGQAPPAAAETPLYVFGPTDVVEVAVFDERNTSGTFSIGPDGRMSMPLIGNFKADGLTIPQLADLIKQKLRDDGGILDPVVNVQLLRNNSKKYTVIGGVLRAGPAPLLQETTILEALAATGGFKEFASPSKIYLMRGTKKYPFNYKQVMKGQHMEQNIRIQDGDLIIVPE